MSTNTRLIGGFQLFDCLDPFLHIPEIQLAACGLAYVVGDLAHFIPGHVVIDNQNHADPQRLGPSIRYLSVNQAVVNP